MRFQLTDNIVAQVEDLIAENNGEALTTFLQEFHFADIAELLDELEHPVVKGVRRVLDLRVARFVLEHMRVDPANTIGPMRVNASMARLLWPGKEAIGQCIKVGADTMPCSTVVGVAEDVRRSGFDVHEHYPAIDKDAGLPGWPFRASVRWAPHFLPWQGLKLAARAPGALR